MDRQLVFKVLPRSLKDWRCRQEVVMAWSRVAEVEVVRRLS